MNERFLGSAQWTTSARLLKLGESIEFRFFLPADSKSGDLEIFPRYLERARPGRAFVAGSDLNWLERLDREQISLSFSGGRACVEYRPESRGNYLARWRVDEEILTRYFSVVEHDSIVCNFSTFDGLESEPTLHATGFPLDYRLPVERFHEEDPLYRKFLNYHRHFGDALVPAFPDTPNLTVEERVREYGRGLERVRALVPDPGEIRSLRVDMRHDLDSGYTETFKRLGIVDHCGLNEANARPWLGMPEFAYFASPVDCRKANQKEGGIVAHQWDFCGGWHFLGPVSWHYKAAEGDWTLTEQCLKQGMEEFRNLTELSGHPAFVTPLYDGLVGPGYPNPSFQYGVGEAAPRAAPAMARFVERYQRFIAFVLPKKHKVVFARSIDIADYYRRHYHLTPRTIFVSKTDHVLYDRWWLCNWCNENILVPRERIPWDTRMSSIFRLREAVYPFKDPLSHEYVLVEDHRRSIRFERECPNPVWWFDYTAQERGPEGSAITWTRTPEVEVRRSQWSHTDRGLTLTLKMLTSAESQDYAVCLWGLPTRERLSPAAIATNAKEFVLARNTDGEQHLVLFFDLRPGVEIEVVLHPGQR
ncbi:MAG: hypothetical protein HY318_11145 [Armatimonadetes bacterium]|nr:hypothetical protein [Armatimonadota bacterium]